jgi:hypothetical protein
VFPISISEIKQKNGFPFVDVRKIAVVSLIAGLLALKISGATVEENILSWYVLFYSGSAVTILSFAGSYKNNEANIGKKQNLFMFGLSVVIIVALFALYLYDSSETTWVKFFGVAFGLVFVTAINVIMGSVLGRLLASVVEIIKDGDIALREKIKYTVLLFLTSGGMLILIVGILEPKRIVPLLPVIGILLGSLIVPIVAAISRQGSFRGAIQ